MDWSFAKSLSEKEQMRLWVETWKKAGPELERIKREELRSMTEEEAYDRAVALSKCLEYDHWVNPRRRHDSGLIAQQAIFGRARGANS